MMFVKGQRVVNIRKPANLWFDYRGKILTITPGSILTVYEVYRDGSHIQLREYLEKIQYEYKKRDSIHYTLDDCGWWLEAAAFEPFPE